LNLLIVVLRVWRDKRYNLDIEADKGLEGEFPFLEFEG